MLPVAMARAAGAIVMGKTVTTKLEVVSEIGTRR